MLHILHVNDTETPPHENWPQLATLIRQRRNDGLADLVLHAGDICLGRPYGFDLVNILNALQFDAVTLGNHDFDRGVTNLDPQLAKLQSAVLCANIVGYAAVQPTLLTTCRSPA